MLSIKAVYEEYNRDVFGYLYSLTHNSDLSEDLTSETFLSALKGLPEFRGDAQIKTWLFSIARHKWYEHIRRDKKEVTPEQLAGLYITGFGDIESYAESTELYNTLLTTLRAYGEREKDVVLMRTQGYSYNEIASKLGISESSARVIEFRTRKRLLDELSDII